MKTDRLLGFVLLLVGSIVLASVMPHAPQVTPWGTIARGIGMFVVTGLFCLPVTDGPHANPDRTK